MTSKKQERKILCGRKKFVSKKYHFDIYNQILFLALAKRRNNFALACFGTQIELDFSILFPYANNFLKFRVIWKWLWFDKLIENFNFNSQNSRKKNAIFIQKKIDWQYEHRACVL